MAVNGIEHKGAYDALVDVYATIKVAKLIKTA
jgi:exodeoxyribonuclease-1